MYKQTNNQTENSAVSVLGQDPIARVEKGGGLELVERLGVGLMGRLGNYGR